MKKTTITWAILSLIAVGVSAATSDHWFLPALWAVTATIWGFTAGMEHADKAWRDAR